MKIRRGGSFSSGMIVMYRGAVRHIGVKLAEPGEAPGKYSFDQKICDTDSGFNQTKLENQHGRRTFPLWCINHFRYQMAIFRFASQKVPPPPLAVKFGIPE